MSYRFLTYCPPAILALLALLFCGPTGACAANNCLALHDVGPQGTPLAPSLLEAAPLRAADSSLVTLDTLVSLDDSGLAILPRIVVTTVSIPTASQGPQLVAPAEELPVTQQAQAPAPTPTFAPPIPQTPLAPEEPALSPSLPPEPSPAPAPSFAPAISPEAGHPSFAPPTFAAPTDPLGHAHVWGPVPMCQPECDSYDHWIISSRACSKKQRCNSCGCVQVFRRAGQAPLHEVDPAQFPASLDPNVPVCFFIHGSYHRFDHVVSDARKVERWLRGAAPGQPLQVVYFTWPSGGEIPLVLPIDISILARRSGFHGLFLAETIGRLPPTQPVTVIGHSLGARTAVSALHVLGGGCIERGVTLATPCAARQINVVLLAAAIDHDWLNPGERYGCAISQIDRLLIVHNSKDPALALYPLRKPFGARSLGRTGPRDRDLFALGEFSQRISLLDAAPLIRRHHVLSNYYEQPALATAMAPYIHAQPAFPATGVEGPALGTPTPILPATR